MVYTYTPAYYSTIHDSITSLCKNILPFPFKKKRLPAIAAAEQKLSKQQSDNLKWQQESFHQILKLMGLCKEGIVPETEVSAFKSHLVETLIASPVDYEQPTILRDKLIFLQELLYAKCISEDEYHSSKRPLLQRLAVQGVEIEARDVIVGAARKESSNEEWSEIDLKDERCLLSKESSNSKNKSKQGSSSKQIKGATSVLGFISSNRNGKAKEEKGVFDLCNENNRPNNGNMKNELGLSTENPFWNSHFGEKESKRNSILMSESLPSESVKVEKQSGGDKAKRKPFRALFQKDQREEGHGDGSDNRGTDPEEKATKSGKKQWPFDGFKKWKKNDCEDETAPLSLGERSDGKTNFVGGKLVENPVGEGPDTKQIKKKLHPGGAPSDYFVDKVLGDKIKKELSRIQTELSTKNPDVHFTDDQIDVISTRLPVDKADLKKFFPKSWCDRYGDVVLDVVRKEFKDHVGEMGNLQGIARERRNSKKWTTFDDAENCYPDHFATQNNNFYMNNQAEHNPLKDARVYTNSSSIDKGFKYNPFFDV